VDICARLKSTKVPSMTAAGCEREIKRAGHEEMRSHTWAGALRRDWSYCGTGLFIG
jgi:hypothetical protein